MEETSTATAHGRPNRRPRLPPLSESIDPGDITFRLLCSYTTSGAVIGKYGSLVKLLEQQTGAKIRAEYYRYRSDERVITIIGPESPKKTITISKKNEPKHQREDVSPAQQGLVRVLERIWEIEAQEDKHKIVTCRLLADKNQIGYLMGKCGKRIVKLESDYKARIRVLADVPACAPRNHEVIQITGVSLAVKRATLAVSQCLLDVSPSQMPGCKTFTLPPDRPFSDPYTKSLPQQSSFPHQVSSSVDCASRSSLVPGEEEVVFRLLCTNTIIRGVTGKNANFVKALEAETGASIRAEAPIAESADQVIHISAMENPGSQYSPAQNAVICVFKRSTGVGIGKKLVSGALKDPVVEARLLISLEQAGCLIGVGGAIISEIRKTTQTSMWILRDGEVPPCAAENDAVLKIEGFARNVEHALFIVTGKLRNTIFCNNMVNTAGRIKEPIAAGSYPSLYRSLKPGQQATLTDCMHRLGLSHTMGYSASADPWRSEKLLGENSRGVTDTRRGAVDPRGGLEYGSGKRSAVVMNTILEISVPEYVLGSVDEEKENNLILSRLRQISGAKVSVHDPILGSDETTLVISGTPDQTQAAQSVLQALILTRQNS